jgi:CRP-like cAMP-binding protein
MATTRSQRAQLGGSLRNITLFDDLADEDVAHIQNCCHWRRYEPGQVIVDRIDRSDDVFFIVSGDVRVTMYSLTGKEVSFRDLGPGKVFGEYAAIDGGARSASVEAHTSCLVASMPAATFRELLNTQPAVTQELLRQLVANIRSLTMRVYEFSTLAVNNRIQAELLRLANLTAGMSNSALISPAPTHSEIASRISTHREAVTRELNRLARIGLIERPKNAIVVKDLSRLKELVHNAGGE